MVETRARTHDQAPIQKAAMLFGIVFLLVTILGFIPGVTSDYDRLTEFGDVGAKVLGIFGVNWLENVVHLLYGVLGLALVRSWNGSRAYFIGGGLVYLAVWLYGLLIDLDSSANIIGVNSAANWLHFVIGLTMLLIGFVLGRDRGYVAGRDGIAAEAAPRL
jgi:arginine exporter protein ArgO